MSGLGFSHAPSSKAVEEENHSERIVRFALNFAKPLKHGGRKREERKGCETTPKLPKKVQN